MLQIKIQEFLKIECDQAAVSKKFESVFKVQTSM